MSYCTLQWNIRQPARQPDRLTYYAFVYIAPEAQCQSQWNYIFRFQ